MVSLQQPMALEYLPGGFPLRQFPEQFAAPLRQRPTAFTMFKACWW